MQAHLTANVVREWLIHIVDDDLNFDFHAFSPQHTSAFYKQHRHFLLLRPNVLSKLRQSFIMAWNFYPMSQTTVFGLHEPNGRNDMIHTISISTHAVSHRYDLDELLKKLISVFAEED